MIESGGNRGEARESRVQGRLTVLGGQARAAQIPPPLCEIEHYKRTIRDVGTEAFRVSA